MPLEEYDTVYFRTQLVGKHAGIMLALAFPQHIELFLAHAPFRHAMLRVMTANRISGALRKFFIQIFAERAALFGFYSFPQHAYRLFFFPSLFFLFRGFLAVTLNPPAMAEMIDSPAKFKGFKLIVQPGGPEGMEIKEAVSMLR